MSLTSLRLRLNSQGLLRLQTAGAEFLLLNSSDTSNIDYNAPEFWVAGARVLFQQKKSDGAGAYPLMDLGIIQASVPRFRTVRPVLLDRQGGGGSRVISADITECAESWSIVASNLNIENRGLLYNAVPQNFTQAASPLTNLPHSAVVGHLLKVSSAGKPLFALSSVNEVRKGAAILTAGADYTVLDLDTGTIRIEETAATGAAGDVISLSIDATTAALSGKRLLNPKTEPTINGCAYIFIGRGNNAHQTVRFAEVSITPVEVKLPGKEFSTLVLDMNVVNKVTSTQQPAGFLLDFK